MTVAGREYNYRKALTIDTSFRDLATTIQNTDFKYVATAYAKNMERILAMGWMPWYLGNMVSRVEDYRQAAMNSLKLFADEDHPPEPERPSEATWLRDDTQREAWERREEERYQKMVVERQVRIKSIDRHREQFMKYQEEFDRRSKLETYGLGLSDGTIDDMLGLEKDSDKEKFTHGLDATLHGMVIGAWTAFETLATDLWVSAVNMSPSTLGVAALESSTIKREDRPIGDEMAKKRPNPISLDILRKYEFNLSKSMGTMLWREEKVGFNSLESIITSYKGAFAIFHKDGNRSECPQEVKKWFMGEDFDKLRALEAARHVLVHRAGTVDVAFLERIKEKFVAFSKLRVGDTIQLDGELVRDLISASIKRGRILLQGVDQWPKPLE